MKYIVSIADKNYYKYAQRLFMSCREHGWRNPIILFTPDDHMYCNEIVIKVDRTIIPPGQFKNDARWIMFDMIDHFSDGDEIMYIDADCVVKSDDLFKKAFGYPFALTKHVYKVDENDRIYDNWKKIKQLTGKSLDAEYIATPWVFRITPSVKRFFKIGWAVAHASLMMRSGIITAFTSACILSKMKIKWFDEELFGYPYSDEGEWLYHYGGKNGKKEWEQEWGH